MTDQNSQPSKAAPAEALSSPGSALLPCPFCGNELYRSPRNHNPKAYCVTEGCYGKRMSVVNLDDPVCLAMWNSRAPQPLTPAQDAPKWRHLKRGSIVTEIARGFAQVACHPIEEMTCVVIYRHDADGRYWVRNAVEFDDGRFEAYPLPSTERS